MSIMQAFSYVINVSQNGKHVFRTDPDTLVDSDKAKVVYVDICSRFPPEQGFDVELSEWRCFGTRMALRARASDGSSVRPEQRTSRGNIRKK
jgi:hypothetical protein